MPLYRKAEDKDLMLGAYKAILDLIPKLKRLLPVQEDADSEYFYGVVNAVRTAYMHPAMC
jgi:hypothetical protein